MSRPGRAPVAGLSSTNPPLTAATPAIRGCAAGRAGGTPAAPQVDPPSRLSQAPLVWLVTVRRPLWPLLTALVVVTSPAIRIREPSVAAYLMSCTRPAPAGRRSW